MFILKILTFEDLMLNFILSLVLIQLFYKCEYSEDDTDNLQVVFKIKYNLLKITYFIMLLFIIYLVRFN